MKAAILASILALGTLAGAQPAGNGTEASGSCSACGQIALIGKLTNNDCAIAAACAKALGGGMAASDGNAGAANGTFTSHLSLDPVRIRFFACSALLGVPCLANVFYAL